MKSIIAFIFPWSLFMTIHRPAEATVCLMLQISILGWIPADAGGLEYEQITATICALRAFVTNYFRRS